MINQDDFLEKIESQWLLGDWDSLSCLQWNEIIDSHAREKLALFAASGFLQMGKNRQAREYIQQAKNWGAKSDTISKILVSTVHSTLGRAFMAMGQEDNALAQINKAIESNLTVVDKGLHSNGRLIRDSIGLGLLPQAIKLIKKNIDHERTKLIQDDPRLKILETEIELLSHELSIAQQRQQLGFDLVNSDLELSENDWKDRLQRQSVSQLGQDLWVLEKTDYKRGGFFVEFGATDGVLLSNTWLLEKKFGWKGICAEPNPKFFKQLQKNRSCIVSDECISGETGKEVEFIFADAYGGSNEYADADMHKEKRAAYKATNQFADLITISLHDFLVQHNAPSYIDYLSVDTEGSEYEILNAFPFDKWNIRLLTVEHNFTSQRELIQTLLESHGYKRYEAKWDDWYLRDV